MSNFLVSFLIVVFVVVLSVGGLIYQQRRFIYYPEPFRTLPAEAGLNNITELTLDTPDKEKLIAWYSKAAPGQPTILYFHGNGGSLRFRAQRVMLMQQQGYGVFMLSYRGYGGSSGSPTERHIIEDALLSYDWLSNDGVSGEHIVLYGESLGTGVAVQLGAREKTACVILEAPYTSLPELARTVYPFLPTRILMRDHFDSAKYISRIGVPLLVLHGALDLVVPAVYGKKLYSIAKSPKSIEVFPHGAHSDLYLHGAWDRVKVFVEKNCVLS